ncbi:unnamed protein product [Discula destructiva]
MKPTIISLCALLLATSALASPLDHGSKAQGSVLHRQENNATEEEDAAAAAGAAAGAAADGENLQTFTGTLGGDAPVVVNNGNENRPFTVNGNTFANLNAALGRSCDVQKNACANVANSDDTSVTSVSECDDQNAECRAAL